MVDFKEKREKDDVIFNNNRRQNTRINAEINVSFEVSLDGPHTFFSGFTMDISKGGVFLATSQVYPVGTEVFISFILEGREYNVMTKVMWIRDPKLGALGAGIDSGMGLLFINMSDSDVKAIESFIAKKEPLMVDMDD